MKYKWLKIMSHHTIRKKFRGGRGEKVYLATGVKVIVGKTSEDLWDKPEYYEGTDRGR